MTGADAFDDLVDQYRNCTDDMNIPARKIETPTSRKRRKRQEAGFIKVPLVWSLALANSAHTATRAVSDCLLYSAWKNKGGPVVLSNLALEVWKVAPREKSRALKELEALKLISIERCRRKAPRITLLKI